ncbi:MAG: ATP-binding protein [Spirochaetes bacterium]|nr:ATP-binding protein [Spirochaetota bacterium]
MAKIRRLEVNEYSPYFTTEGMRFREFPSRYRQIRNYATIIAFEAPNEFKMGNLLEQQISELIKNAVIHGNRKDESKVVRAWWEFKPKERFARIIVEDQGEGFTTLEQWNEFNEKRTKYFLENNFDEMLKFISYRTSESSELDGGNALFAAIEFWNSGMIYNKKKNKVVALRYYTDKELKGEY